MNNNKIKKIILPAILLPLFIFSNIALASEVTGTLSTGVSTIGNTLTGTVTNPTLPTTTPSSGGIIGRSGGGGGYRLLALANTDTNSDGRVDIMDFVTLMANWGKTGSNVVGDFNTDGRVDVLDFVMLMANWTI